MLTDFSGVASELTRITNHRRIGRVVAVGTASLEIAGLTHQARIGDQVAIAMGAGRSLGGEIVGISEDHARAMTYAPLEAAAVGNRVTLLGPAGVHPDASWVGRIVDAFGQSLDGRPLKPGAASATLRRVVLMRSRSRRVRPVRAGGGCDPDAPATPSDSDLPEPIDQLPHGDCPMADPVLFLCIQVTVHQ